MKNTNKITVSDLTYVSEHLFTLLSKNAKDIRSGVSANLPKLYELGKKLTYLYIKVRIFKQMPTHQEILDVEEIMGDIYLLNTERSAKISYWDVLPYTQMTQPDRAKSFKFQGYGPEEM